MSKAELHDLVEQPPDAAVEGVSILLKDVILGQIDAHQAWCWTDEWQAKLRASLADWRAAG